MTRQPVEHSGIFSSKIIENLYILKHKLHGTAIILLSTDIIVTS